MKIHRGDGYIEFEIGISDDPTDPQFNPLFDAVLESEASLVQFWAHFDAGLTHLLDQRLMTDAQASQQIDRYLAALRNAFLRMVNDPEIPHELIQAITDTLFCAFILQAAERHKPTRT